MKNKKYFNFHKHSYSSNVATIDCTVSNDDYAKRAIELGHEWLSSCEHSGIPNWVNAYMSAKNNKLKYVHTGEFYFVPDRNIELKDKSNYHLILVAKTRKAFEELNYIMSEANSTGYYYKARIDIELLRGLPKGEVYCTSACFLNGTMVETKNGFKKIEDITSNDYVLTHNNNYEKVNAPTRRYFSGDMVKLTFNRSNRVINCTYNHKYLIYDKINNKTLWKEAINLREEDTLLTSIPNVIYTNNKKIIFEKCKSRINYKKLKKCNHEIVLDEKDMMTFGLWLGDGYMSNRGTGYEVGFSFNINEFDNYYNGFVKHTMSKFGIEPSITYKEKNNRVDIAYIGKELYNIFYQLFENKKANDKFIPNKLKNISKDFDKALLFGYLLADGYFRYRKSDGGEVVSVTISQRLHLDMLNIYKTLNCIPTERVVEGRIDNKGVNHKKSYYLSIGSSRLGKINKLESIDKQYEIFKKEIETGSSSKDIICVNGNKYFKRIIKSISTYKYDGYVYCLNVGTSHSFNCEGIIVHNCLGGFLRDYPKTEPILEELIDIFGENLFLEVQPHKTEKQINYNKLLKEISQKHGIKLIGACDSHMIYENGILDRDYLLHSKGIVYEDEEGWYAK